jgi:hypothetical protein
MEWSRSNTLALSKVNCPSCAGSGTFITAEGEIEPCHCVLRAIFQACYRRFVECAGESSSDSRVSMERGASHSRSGGWGRKEEEYVADFCLIAKRTLTEAEYKIFRYHFLLGADYNLCCRKLQMDRGLFFHAVYRIKRKLGRAFRETQPYPLYPVNDYFEGEWKQHSAIMPETASGRTKQHNPFPWLRKAA